MKAILQSEIKFHRRTTFFGDALRSNKRCKISGKNRKEK